MSLGPLSYRYQNGVCSIEGVLDESATPVFEAIGREAAASPRIAFELGEIKRINSLGVRAWCGFMKTLSDKAVTFRRCSPAIVEQMNTVLGFSGKAKVESFLAPYVCETSGKTFYIEMTVGRDVTPGDFSGLGPRPCTECADPMEFDDIPERYIGFLSFN